MSTSVRGEVDLQKHTQRFSTKKLLSTGISVTGVRVPVDLGGSQVLEVLKISEKKIYKILTH
jgi:hypothetical protein